MGIEGTLTTVAPSLFLICRSSKGLLQEEESADLPSFCLKQNTAVSERVVWNLMKIRDLLMCFDVRPVCGE